MQAGGNLLISLFYRACARLTQTPEPLAEIANQSNVQIILIL